MQWEQLIFRIYDYNLKRMLYSDPKQSNFYYDTEFDKPICYNAIEKIKVFKEHKYSEPMSCSLRKDYKDKCIFENDIVYYDTSDPHEDIFYIVIFKNERWIFKGLFDPKTYSKTFKECSFKNDSIEKIIYGSEYSFINKVIIEGNMYQDLDKFLSKEDKEDIFWNKYKKTRLL